MRDTRLHHSATSVASTEDLVVAAQNGCHVAFEQLQKTYSRRLFKQIVGITRHHEDAEDALQETFYKAYIALPSFERRCHVYTWLSRIAINCALMRVRKLQALRELSIDADPNHVESGPSFDLPDWRWSPEELCRAKEKIQQIAIVAESLDPMSRRILRLRADHDYSMDEIARSLNISVCAVKARLYRARHALRVFMPIALSEECCR